MNFILKNVFNDAVFNLVTNHVNKNNLTKYNTGYSILRILNTRLIKQRSSSLHRRDSLQLLHLIGQNSPFKKIHPCGYQQDFDTICGEFHASSDGMVHNMYMASNKQYFNGFRA